jgi:hypothetical protein
MRSFSTTMCFCIAAGIVITATLARSIPMLGLVVFVLLLGILLWRRDKKVERAALAFIGSQATILARRRAQLVFVDDRGTEQLKRWEKEKRHFLQEVLPAHLGAINLGNWRGYFGGAAMQKAVERSAQVGASPIGSPQSPPTAPASKAST